MGWQLWQGATLRPRFLMLSGEVAALPRLLTRLDSFSDRAPAFMLAGAACCAPESRLPRSLPLPLAFPLACHTRRHQCQAETISAGP